MLWRAAAHGYLARTTDRFAHQWFRLDRRAHMIYAMPVSFFRTARWLSRYLPCPDHKRDISITP